MSFLAKALTIAESTPSSANVVSSDVASGDVVSVMVSPEWQRGYAFPSLGQVLAKFEPVLEPALRAADAS
jgi:hypothetical protein